MFKAPTSLIWLLQHSQDLCKNSQGFCKHSHNHFITLIVSSTLLQPVIALSWTLKHSYILLKLSQGLYSILTAFISYLTVSLSTLMSLREHSQPPNHSWPLKSKQTLLTNKLNIWDFMQYSRFNASKLEGLKWHNHFTITKIKGYKVKQLLHPSKTIVFKQHNCFITIKRWVSCVIIASLLHKEGF